MLLLHGPCDPGTSEAFGDWSAPEDNPLGSRTLSPDLSACSVPNDTAIACDAAEVVPRPSQVKQLVQVPWL